MKKHLPVSMVTLGAVLLPASVWAHAGHEATTGFISGLGHPLAGADHLLAMIAVGMWAAQRGGRAIWALPGAFVGVMIVGAIFGQYGVSVPHVEVGILVSVLLLGLLIATAFRLPVGASAAIVAVFGISHGHAHGAEIPAALGAVSYTAGFVTGTVLLHALGVAGSVLLQRVDIERAVRLAGSAIALGGVYLALA